MTSNPWLPHSDVAPAPTARQVRAPSPSGATAPQPGIPVPDQVDQLPSLEHAAAAPLWWLGAHGGAGEWTMAQLVPQWRAADHAWPLVVNGQTPARTVLVARSSARGLRAAQMAAAQWASGIVPHVTVLGLVVIADAPGRLPRPLRDLIKVVGGGVPRVWQLPWVESWRLGEPVSLKTAPREVRKLVEDLRALLQAGAEGTTN
ncbi:hypothetical protein ATJ97_0069 [Georgenia soli]|uniref:Uncharacterized protein n=1 Tax=Georgenia soli TaxID=638953 RepID=A0A2A9F175_9MICO|nr:DUF6668 family protein [Georgenia soli]PFG45147.1 hypothetical protein ATJ97_0069 [Georgenia soli]